MHKTDIIQFFDRLAPQWDNDMIRNDDIINLILDNAGVKEGLQVLDVACGTGVLIPDYLARNVASVTGIDISSHMIEIARGKFTDPRVNFVCADAEITSFPHPFDCCVVYNAFPHFLNPENLIKTLAGNLKKGGSLTVAHGMSRAKIDRHHSGSASGISVGLMNENDLARLFEPWFNVTVKLSNNNMYQVVGTKL